jgi:hypothetical protein
MTLEIYGKCPMVAVGRLRISGCFAPSLRILGTTFVIETDHALGSAGVESMY